MALNKAKVLKSAEKYVAQGKISHAITEYQKLIKEDPTDLPLVNTLGDLHVRIGHIPEAVKCFTRLAESYDNGGFVVRAIAMYKKVCKIDPAQFHALTRLADLYVRQGLMSDARTHYLQAAESLLRRSDWKEAAAVLRKICEVDPDNPAIEGRLAEVYQKLGNDEEAVKAFQSAAQKSRRRTSFDEAEVYLRKACEIRESDTQIAIAYAEVLSELGKTDQALGVLDKFQFLEFKPEILEGRFHIHLKATRYEEALKTAAHLTEIDSHYYRLHLELAKAYADGGNFDQAATEIGKVISVAVERGEGLTIEEGLRAFLHVNPEHVPSLLELIRYYNAANLPHNLPVLLEKVGDIFVRREKFLEAASIYTQLARLEPSNPAHRESLRQIKARLGPEGENIELPRLLPDMSSIAEKFVSEPTLKTIAPATPELGESSDEEDRRAFSDEQIKGFVVEGDLFASYGLFRKAIEQYRKVLDLVPNHIEIHEKIRDMYAKAGELPNAAQQCLVLASIYTARGDSENAHRNFSLAYQYDPNLHQEPIYHDHAAMAEPATSTAPAIRPEAPGDAKRLQELLEEADFYLQQNFLAEAKRCIDEHLLLAPDDPQGLRRLDIYREQLRMQEAGPQPISSGPGSAEMQSPETGNLVQEIRAEGFETTAVAPPAEAVSPGTAPGFETTSPPPAEAASPTAVSEASEPVETFHEMMIDLDTELESSALETPAQSLPLPSASPPDKASETAGLSSGLDDVFQEFKAGLEDEEGESVDHETHYNLGIAFKEMGLLEEAIGEFQKALKGLSPVENSEEFVKCCNMLGLCFLEKALPQVAIKWFTRGLESPGRDEETYQALRYDLACAHEQAGDHRAALDVFLDVYGVNVNYRDVADKIESLKKTING